MDVVTVTTRHTVNRQLKELNALAEEIGLETRWGICWGSRSNGVRHVLWERGWGWPDTLGGDAAPVRDAGGRRDDPRHGREPEGGQGGGDLRLIARFFRMWNLVASHQVSAGQHQFLRTWFYDMNWRIFGEE